MKFQPGDIVQCIAGRGSSETFNLPTGKIFVVTAHCSYSLYLQGSTLGYKSNRFILYSKENGDYNPVLDKIKTLSKRFEERKSNDIR